MATMLKIIRLIGLTECLIGLATLIGVLVYSMRSLSQKGAGVFAFVIAAAAVSFWIGVRVLALDERARRWLVYFSGTILLEKTLIFMGVLSLNGKILTTVFGIGLDSISFVYHGLILLILTRPGVRPLFR